MRLATSCSGTHRAHDEHVQQGCERFFRPGYLNNLASAWIPALDGVDGKLAAGARVADVGCGHGASTLLLADAYPASAVTGFDAHDGSIEAARKRAADAGLAERVRFEVASATTFSGSSDLAAPRGAVLYRPRSGQRWEELSLDQMANPRPERRRGR